MPLEQVLGDQTDQTEKENNQVVEAEMVDQSSPGITIRPAPEAEALMLHSPPEQGPRSSPAMVPTKKGKGQKDGRLKGEAPRVRMNVMLDEEVAEFLRTMKASAQATTKEQGYSGFLERLVRESLEFQRHKP